MRGGKKTTQSAASFASISLCHRRTPIYERAPPPCCSPSSSFQEAAAAAAARAAAADGDGARRPPATGNGCGVRRGDGARPPRGVVTRAAGAEVRRGPVQTFGLASISRCRRRSAFLLAGFTPPLAFDRAAKRAGSTRGETGTLLALRSASADNRADRRRSTDAARLL